MKLVARVQLRVTSEEQKRLLATMVRVNEACSWLATKAFELRTTNKVHIQKLFYRDLRERFGLPAQHAVRAISKTSEAFKVSKTKAPRFREHGAIAYDQRIYSFKNGLSLVSLLALDGRMVVPCSIGSHHAARLAGARGQADLVYRKGKFFLFITVDVPTGSPIEAAGWLGVDLGICNIAVDSDGEHHSGSASIAKRSQIAKLRTGLQRADTRSARRHLRKLSRRVRDFNTHTNHVISKHLVRKAKDTGRGIAVENIDGIRERVTVRSKAVRAELHGWSFHQLRMFITYKGLLAGVPVVAVDARNTSRTCPACGLVDKANRKSRSAFVCIGCGFAGDADHVAARNIASRGSVIGPIGPDERAGTPSKGNLAYAASNGSEAP